MESKGNNILLQEKEKEGEDEEDEEEEIKVKMINNEVENINDVTANMEFNIVIVGKEGKFTIIIYILFQFIGVGKKTLLNYIQNKYLNNILSTSVAQGKQLNQSSFMSEKDEEVYSNCIRLFYSVNFPNKNKQLIVCLRIYDSELSQNFFFITPQAFFLLYDITSKVSFDSVVKYYKTIKEDKKYEDAKFILVGNKTDLIDEVNSEITSEIEADEKDKVNVSEEKEIIREEKDYNINENKDDDKEEKNENIENSQELKEIKENQNETNNKSRRITINFKEDNKTNNHNYLQEIMKKEKFALSKEVSGLNGDGLEELLNETVILLYKMVKEMQSSAYNTCQIEGESTIIENKLQIDNKQKSYHDLEYKKEVKKINDSKTCCFFCEIY